MENQIQPNQPVQPSQPVQPTQPSVAMQIQQLLGQQQQLQQQYNQVVAQRQANPNKTQETKAAVEAQLGPINAQYVQNQQQLQALGYNVVQVNKSVAVKEGAKNNFSFKKLAIGCGFLLFLIAVGFAATLYFLRQNPNALTGVGINASTAKSLLTMFAGLVVGGIWLVGIGFLVSNIYRLITVKNQSKLRYIFSLLLAVLVLGATAVGAVAIFREIWKIDVGPVAVSTTLVSPHLVVKGYDGTVYERGEPKLLNRGAIKSIAPGEVIFTRNAPAWQNYLTKLGEVQATNFILNCGNPQKQILTYIGTGSNGGFDGKCFYDKKGSYPISTVVTYTNTLTKERGLKHEQFVANLIFDSEIQLFQTNSQSTQKTTPLSATQGMVILGKAPIKVTVDATSVFRDFALKTYEVVRDMDGDEVNDRENMTTFDYIYKVPKVYYPTVKFSWMSDYLYTFPVRIEQSDVPVCEITFTLFEKSKYKIQTNFIDGSVSNISSYSYTILNSNKKVIDTIKKDTRDLDYVFPEKGSYLVLLDFVTVDGKRGKCESDLLELKKEDIEVTAILRNKLPDEAQFKVLLPAFRTEQTIPLTRIPQTIQVDLVSVVPDTISTQKNVYVDGKVILNNGTLYQFDIHEEKTYEILIKVEDTDRGFTTELPLRLVVERPDIVGNFTLSVDQGYEPLSVILDASKTTLNIPNDEIVYFSRDFGDGSEGKKNLTNGVISHVYRYDGAKENGEFMPKVTVQTRQGLTATFSPERSVLVKKQLIQVALSSTSHPTQIAKVGDIVNFFAEFNGLPETIKWSFGDGSDPVQCKGRSCVETSHMYALPGSYIVHIVLEFSDMQTVESTMEVKIN